MSRCHNRASNTRCFYNDRNIWLCLTEKATTRCFSHWERNILVCLSKKATTRCFYIEREIFWSVSQRKQQVGCFYIEREIFESVSHIHSNNSLLFLGNLMRSENGHFIEGVLRGATVSVLCGWHFRETLLSLSRGGRGKPHEGHPGAAESAH